MGMVSVGNSVDEQLKDAGVEIDPPVEAPKAEAEEKPVKEAKESKETEGDDDDHDYAKELGLTKEQHEKFTKTIQRAVAKKHRQLRETEEFAEAQYTEKTLAERQRDDYAKRIAELEAKAAPKVEAKPEIEPNRGDFQTEDAYQDAKVSWRVKQELKARDEAAEATRQEQEQVRQAQVIEAAKARVAKAIELQPDFKEATENADFIVPGHIGILMQESERFPEIAYHFAKNPESLGKLAILSADRAKVAFRELESTIKPFGSTESTSNGTPPSTTDVSQSRPRAPAPIRPLDTGSSPQVAKPEQKMNVREVMTKWQAERQVNLNRRKRH